MSTIYVVLESDPFDESGGDQFRAAFRLEADARAFCVEEYEKYFGPGTADSPRPHGQPGLDIDSYFRVRPTELR